MARSLIQAVSDIQGRGQVAPQVARPVDDGMADAMSQAASAFAGVAGKIGHLADRAAAREGDVEGRAAGLDPEFRTRRDGTIRGEAFDRAGLDVAETRLRTTLEEGINGLFQKHAGDPGKLADGIDGVARGVLAAAPDELRPGLEMLVKGKRLSFMREATRLRIEQSRAESTAALQHDLSQTLAGMHQRAFAMGLDAAANEAAAGDLVALSRMLGRKGVDGRPLVSPAQAEKLLSGAREEVATARLYGAFERQPNLAAKEQFLKQLGEDFAASRGLAKEYDLGGFQRVVGHLEGELRSAKVEARAVAHALKEDVTSVQRMAEKGYALPPDRLAAIKARVAMTDDATLQAGLAQAEGLAHWQAAARKTTPVQLDEFIRAEEARLQKDGADPFSVKRLEIARTLHGKMVHELKENMLGWADRAGVLKIAPLDFSSAEAAAGSIKRRIGQAVAVAETYGRPPQYLFPDEREEVSARIAKGGKDSLQVLGLISTAAPAQADAILGEIGKSGPTAALLGRLYHAAGATKTVKDAVDGLALIRVPDYKRVAPEVSKLRQPVVDVTMGALDSFPGREAAVINLASAIYEKTAHVAGKTTAFDETLYKEAVRAALGESKVGNVTYGGVAQYSWWSSSRAIVLPPYLRQDKWQDAVAAITPDDLKAAGLQLPVGTDGKPVAWSRIAAGTLIQVADDRYAVSLGSSGDKDMIVRRADDRSQQFVIDFRALRPHIAKRRDDLFLPER